ncbi:MAG: hypothetical protein ACO4AU_12465 [bacterium]
MYQVKLDEEFIGKLSPESKVWLAKAMVAVLIIDKQLDASELPYMKEALDLVSEDQAVTEELMNAAKERVAPELGNLLSDRAYAGEFFYYLATLVAADGKVKTSEVNLLMTVCGKLGFAPKSAKEVLRWASDLVKLNREKQLMVEALSKVPPVYS